MVSEMLGSVLEKENEVSKNEQQAKAQAEQIIKAAEAKAKEIIENAEKEALTQRKETDEKASLQAKELCEKAEAQAVQAVEGLKQSSESKLDEAAKAVKEIILK